MTTRSSFELLRRSGRRVRRGPLSVTFVEAGADEPPRFAYAVVPMVGGAVVRNRLRRRLRAAVAELDPGPGLYLVSASVEATSLSFGELKSTLTRALEATR